MPPILAESAMVFSVMRSYNFKTPGELEELWSLARLIVEVETSFHSNYIPDEDEGDMTAALEADFAIEDVD